MVYNFKKHKRVKWENKSLSCLCTNFLFILQRQSVNHVYTTICICICFYILIFTQMIICCTHYFSVLLFSLNNVPWRPFHIKLSHSFSWVHSISSYYVP